MKRTRTRTLIVAGFTLLLIGALPGSRAQAGPRTQSVGPGGITFPVAGRVTLTWLYSCGDDPTDLRSEYGYRLNGVRHSYGSLAPNASHSCYSQVHTLPVSAGDVLQVWLESYEGFPEACHYGTRHYSPPPDEQSLWTLGLVNVVGTVYWEDMLIGCTGEDGDFDDVLTEIHFLADPPGPPALSVGPPCSKSVDRTVTWAGNSHLEYQVQAAQDLGFSRDLRTSSWIGGDRYTFTGLDEGIYYYRIHARYRSVVGDWSAIESARQDYTPPVTSATPGGTPGLSGWWLSNLTVDLAAAETGCGLQETAYRVDGGAQRVYSGPFIVSGEGGHTVAYYSTDVPGNVEAVRHLPLQIDTVDPATSHMLRGAVGRDGWWLSAVVVRLSSFDATSGLDVTQYRIEGSPWSTYDSSFSVTEEGSHTLEYRSRDVAGNWEADHILPIRIDSVAPGSAVTNLSDGEWLSGTVTVTGTASDPAPGSGVESVAYSHDGGSSWQSTGGTGAWAVGWDTAAGPDGDFDLGSRAEDVAGNVENPDFLTVHVDNTPPNTAIAVNGTDGENGWVVSPVEVTLVADDGAGIGVRRIRYRVGSIWQAYDAPFTISGEGPHTIEYRSVDQLGNREAIRSRSERIDTVAPDTIASPSGTVGHNGWWISDVDVTLSASDATSGVDDTEYWIDGGPRQSYGAPFTVSGDGDHMVGYRSTDVAGNVERDEALSLRIDTLAPDTVARLSGTAGAAGWWRSPVHVALDASDATSGVEESEIDIDGSGWAAYADPVLVSGQGDHGADYRSIDVAGNVESVETISFRIDSVAPRTTSTMSGTLGDNSWYTTPVTLVLSAADPAPGSGVDETFLCDRPTTGFTRYEDGVHDVTYYSTDVAGNQEVDRALSLRVDTVPPLAGVTGGAFCPSCGEVIVLQSSASDGMSGVSSWRLQVRDGLTVVEEWSGDGRPSTRAWSGSGVDVGTYTLVLQIRDRAGWQNVATDAVHVRQPGSPPPPSPSATSTPDSPPPPPATSTPVSPPTTSTPLPTATSRPEDTPSATPTPVRTSTPRPWETPTPTSEQSTPIPTPTPVRLAEVELEPDRGLALVVGVFEDPDADALRSAAEPGLAEWVVRVTAGRGWSHDFAADARGLVTVTLPGPDVYTFTVVDPPVNWVATSRSEIAVRLGEEGGVVILPAAGGKVLPVGVAQRTVFAFGLMPRRIAVFVPLAGAGLLFGIAAAAVFDPRPGALCEFRRVLEAELE